MLQFLQHALQPHDSDGGAGSRSSGSSSTSRNSEYARALVALTAGTAVGALTHSAWTHTKLDQQAYNSEEPYRVLNQAFKRNEQQLQQYKESDTVQRENYATLSEAHRRIRTELNLQAYRMLEFNQRDLTHADIERTLIEEKRALTRENEQLLSKSSAHEPILEALEKEKAQLNSALRAAQAENVNQRGTLAQNEIYLSQTQDEIDNLQSNLRTTRASKNSEIRLLAKRLNDKTAELHALHETHTRLQAELTEKIETLRATNLQNIDQRYEINRMLDVRERDGSARS